MTIVIARKRGEEIMLLADTKVGEPGERRDDDVPGRLKIVTLAPRFTAAFAGNADAAHVHIRKARDAWKAGAAQAALRVLRLASVGGETDFIAAWHAERAYCVRIEDGRVYPVETVAAIGDHEPFEAMIRAEYDDEPPGPPGRGRLRNAFIERLLPFASVPLPPGIGGLPIAAVADPERHRYLALTAACTADLEIEWGKTTYQSEHQVYSGQGQHLQYHIMPATMDDVPVLGLCLPQACCGYIYAPLLDPRAQKVMLMDPGSAWLGQERVMFDRLYQQLVHHIGLSAAV